MADVSKDPGFIDKTTSLGIVPTARGPKEFAAFIKTEVEVNTALSEGVGVQAGVGRLCPALAMLEYDRVKP